MIYILADKDMLKISDRAPLKKANPNSPRAYIWEGLSSEGFLQMRYGALFLGGLFLVGLITEILYGMLFTK